MVKQKIFISAEDSELPVREIEKKLEISASTARRAKERGWYVSAYHTPGAYDKCAPKKLKPRTIAPSRATTLSDEDRMMTLEEIAEKFCVSSSTAVRARERGWILHPSRGQKTNQIGDGRLPTGITYEDVIKDAKAGAWRAMKSLHSLNRIVLSDEIEDVIHSAVVRLYELTAEKEFKRAGWRRSLAQNAAFKYIFRYIFRFSENECGRIENIDDFVLADNATTRYDYAIDALAQSKKILGKIEWRVFEYQVEGYSLTEISLLLGLSPKVISRIFHTAVRKIQNVTGSVCEQSKVTHIKDARPNFPEIDLDLSSGKDRVLCRAMLVARDGWEIEGEMVVSHCGLCGGGLKITEATIDHVIPRSEGGKDEMNNLTLAHDSCNKAKGSFLPAIKKSLEMALNTKGGENEIAQD